jgi:APA family basic amino acid/polyamine antiporter
LPAIPGWLNTAGLLTPAATRKFLSVSVIIIFTYIHYNGLKTGTAIQNVLTFMKIGLILLLIFAGFASGNGNTGNFISGESIIPGFAGWKTAGLSLMWIMFAYSGWNASTYIGSEIASPSRILPRSLIIGTGSVIVLYLGLNALFIYAISPDEMKGVISVGGLAMGNLFGKPAEILVSILISFALFSSLSAFIIIGPRVYYSMAKDGLFFRFAAKVHPRHKVPSNSILLQCLIAVILALSGTFDQVLTYMGFALGIFPILAVTGIFSLRRKNLSGLKIKGYPFTQILYIVTGASILVLSFLERPAESLIALATVLTGIPVYFLFKRRK